MKKTDDKTKKERTSMYLALGLCLSAIGLAALVTFSSLTNFLDENDTSIETPTDDEVLESEVDITNGEEVSSSEENEESSTEESTSDESNSNDEVNEENPVNDQVSATPYTCLDNFIYPVENPSILTEYGADALVYNEVLKDYRLHNAIDFSAELGDNVYSTNNGVVLDCYYDLLLGNIVIIEHGDYEFWYCGLADDYNVAIGDIVNQGDIIGTISTIPYESTTSHIHLQVLKDSEYINPLSLIN